MQIKLTRLRIVVLATLILAAGIYFLLDWLIVTDTEHVEMAVTELARAVEENDVEAIMPFLDDDFNMAGLNLRQFREWHKGILEVLHVKRVSEYETTVEIDGGDRDTARAEVLSFVEADRAGGAQRVDWRLEFRRRGEDEWKLRRVRAFRPRDGREIPLRTVRNLIP